MIYTTGYYGHQPEALKALADALDATVVDIRFMPASHTQLRAELREAQGVIDEQDRALQVQRMLLARMRGAACPCERGRR